MSNVESALSRLWRFHTQQDCDVLWGALLMINAEGLLPDDETQLLVSVYIDRCKTEHSMTMMPVLRPVAIDSDVYKLGA